MLIIYIHNDGTGTNDKANYDYYAYINNKEIDRGRVEGHNREDGYKELLRMISYRDKDKTPPITCKTDNIINNVKLKGIK